MMCERCGERKWDREIEITKESGGNFWLKVCSYCALDLVGYQRE